MFENLNDKLERAFKVLKGQGKVTEINVAETMKEIRRALLDADVNYKTAKDFTDRLKQKALGANVINAISPVALQEISLQESARYKRHMMETRRHAFAFTKEASCKQACLLQMGS